MFKYPLIFSLLILFIACTGDNDSRQLSHDEFAYQLALELSAKVPQLHPDSNKTLVSTSSFKVTTAAVMRIIQAYLGDNQNQITNRSADEIIQIVNENAVKYAEKKLILKEAAQKGIEVTQGEIDTVMKGEYRKWGGEENYRKSLANRKLSYEYILDDLRDGLIVNKYFREVVRPTIAVDEELVKNRFNNYYATVRHILFVIGEQSADEQFQIRKKLEEIRQRAVAGEDFARLAEEFSEDPKTKNQGGLVKDIAHGIMPHTFDEAAFKIPVGQISDVFETQYGFHILKVEERKPYSGSFEKAAPIIREQLLKEDQISYYQEHVINLRNKDDYREFLL